MKNRIELIQGHTLEVLKKLPSGIVQTSVTSPPYWGLRDYGTDPLIWGGDRDCEHEWGKESRKSNRWGGIETISKKQASNYGAYETAGNDALSQGQFCQLCNAWRGSLGLEPTPELYVQHLVEIFREVKRVLRDDGTVWLNIGDSYAGGGGVHGIPEDWDSISVSKSDRAKYPDTNDPKRDAKAIGLKPKDLIGIPWRLAFALQADGWYLRSDIIWAKPNPMPESVTDRPTKAHEYIFLLTKKPKYFYDIDAIREKYISNNGSTSQVCGFRDTPPGSREHSGKGKQRTEFYRHSGRNKRSVWEVTVKSFPEAHFAVFPDTLIEPCIKAGTSEKGCCPKCGAPWKRVMEKPGRPPDNVFTNTSKPNDGFVNVSKRGGMGQKWQNWKNENPPKTIGWKLTCKHKDLKPTQCVVLDPFSGAGTTAIVSARLGRRCIGIELNPKYIKMAKKRLKKIALSLRFY